MADFVGARRGLAEALEDAGVTPADFESVSPRRTVPAERRRIAPRHQVATDEVVAAASGIEQQAREVCKTTWA